MSDKIQQKAEELKDAVEEEAVSFWKKYKFPIIAVAFGIVCLLIKIL